MRNFKKLLNKYKIDGYIVPKNDEYFNEYVYESNNRLKFISNFSGSSGLAVILKNKNYLFVDGRYTIQAHRQSGKKFKVITIPKKFPKDVLKTNKNIVLGFDPKLHTQRQLEYLFKNKKINLRSIDQNLIDLVWSKKPKELIKPFYSISKRSSGRSVKAKVGQIKKILLKNNVKYILISAPENVAWVLNIRGHDTSCSPIPNARLLITNNGDLDIFTNPKKLRKVAGIKLRVHDEKNIAKILSGISKQSILVDSKSCSVFLKNLLAQKNEVKEKIDPIYFLKSIKNNAEIQNMKRSHLVDGVALTKFLLWLKKNFGRKKNYRNFRTEETRKF